MATESLTVIVESMSEISQEKEESGIVSAGTRPDGVGNGLSRPKFSHL